MALAPRGLDLLLGKVDLLDGLWQMIVKPEHSWHQQSTLAKAWPVSVYIDNYILVVLSTVGVRFIRRIARAMYYGINSIFPSPLIMGHTGGKGQRPHIAQEAPTRQCEVDNSQRSPLIRRQRLDTNMEAPSHQVRLNICQIATIGMTTANATALFGESHGQTH
jgi:hypothetical protein